ncbi:unnamed protein product [Phytophthora lilii]|uniref:Unnamed protein product n=1 Tax=Phytophthora lilii TaxID=2077276 RepID=A0A9W6WMT9_9STRA|nr:unnamed protein product [Phytophthora lilii]
MLLSLLEVVGSAVVGIETSLVQVVDSFKLANGSGCSDAGMLRWEYWLFSLGDTTLSCARRSADSCVDSALKCRANSMTLFDVPVQQPKALQPKRPLH